MKYASLFQEHFPNIYVTFASVFESILSEKSEEYFKHLTYLYDLQNTMKEPTLSQSYFVLEGMKFHEKHTLFLFLLRYIPLTSRLLPPCLETLEELLGNAKIRFEDRQATIESLKSNDKFWSTYLELECANKLSKTAADVVVLHRKKSGRKYWDVTATTQTGKTVKIEVSFRRYKANKSVVDNIIINKLEEEAEQFSGEGINVIVLYFADSLYLKNTPFNKMINPFEVTNILRIRREGVATEMKTILDSNPKLHHIAGLLMCFQQISILSQFGQKGSTLSGVFRETVDGEIKTLLSVL